MNLSDASWQGCATSGCARKGYFSTCRKHLQDLCSLNSQNRNKSLPNCKCPVVTSILLLSAPSLRFTYSPMPRSLRCSCALLTKGATATLPGPQLAGIVEVPGANGLANNVPVGALIENFRVLCWPRQHEVSRTLRRSPIELICSRCCCLKS